MIRRTTMRQHIWNHIEGILGFAILIGAFLYLWSTLPK